MARESCNLDKDEAEILKPSSPTPSPAAPPSAPPSLFLKPTPPQESTAQRTDRQAAEPPAVVEEEEEEKQPAEESQPGIRFSNRCSSCRKRVGLAGFRCRCGELFCPRHRYSDTHDCSFDYKTAGRAEISKNNPVVRAAKIIKI